MGGRTGGGAWGRRGLLSMGLPAGCSLRDWRARISALVARAFARTLRAAARVDPERGTRPLLASETCAVSGREGEGEGRAVRL